MNRMFTLQIAVLLLLTCLSCSRQKKDDNFCITYQVSVHDLCSHKLLISYKATDGLETFYCSEKVWTKSVCLHSDDIASLFVEDIFDADIDYQETEDTPETREWFCPPIAAQIIHTKKVILGTGSQSVQVSLLQSEID